jgi:GNAT superfamily N-acetyltransferase
METIRFYFSEPIPHQWIAETFQLSFNQPLDIAYWRWRFLENPASDKTYIAYVKDQQTLVSYYAVSPCRIVINGIEHRIALSNMTMTHPDYQGKGFFKQLATALYRELQNDGFVGVYGFANHNSHYGFRRYLNWNDLSALTNFQVTRETFRHKFTGNQENLTCQIHPLQKGKSPIEEGFRCSEAPVVLGRSSNSLQWRFSDNPQNQYYKLMILEKERCTGVLIFKKYGASLDIMEVFYHPEAYQDSMVLLARGVFQLLQQESIVNFWSNLHSEEHVFLEKIGFQEKGFNTYLGVIPLQDQQDWIDIKKWHYRFMDSDIY